MRPETWKPNVAAAETLLGQLQRGRGSGYLVALEEEPGRVHQLLRVCITEDPRFDRQLETRAFYYADLAIAKNMDLQPLAEHLEGHDDQDRQGRSASLTLYTLQALALRGHRDAVPILRWYVSHGYWWADAVDALGELGEEAVEGLLGVAEKRLQQEADLPEALLGVFPDRFPWSTWMGRSPIVARALDDAGRTRHPGTSPQPNYHAIPTREILASFSADSPRADWSRASRVLQHRSSAQDVEALLEAAETGAPGARAAALMALRKQGRPELIGPASHALDEGTPRMVRAVAIRALESLPGDRTLGLAQDWLDSEVWGRRRAAEGILAAHGTPEDAERIRAALREPLARQDEYRACNLVEALGRLPEVAPFPEIEEVFEQTTYSLCRLRAAKALAATSPEFAGGRAVECLWDCDDETRQIGCQYVELSVRGVRERLDELSGDTLEEEEVRTAARRRVAE